MAALPIDPLVPRIAESLRGSPSLVLEAPPGAGKTTRVPPALLALGQGEVWVLEPRRLAARLAARRVASELGEELGETVGFQVRFEEVSGPRTRLRFLTEGVLTRKMLSNPTLDGVGAVILDEFHERHLEGDFALALLRRLQQNERPDLRLVVMSATLDPGPISNYLGGCPMLKSEGRLFDLAIEYSPVSPDAMDAQIAEAVNRVLRQQDAGDILAFLPGAAEIRKAERACQPIAQRTGLLITPLYGDLSAAEQDRAVSPASHRKLILSTNVAESSITIDGVTAVIDSGLARFARHSPWTGLQSLEVGRISKAAADQRAGRAARTRPGRAIRLYPREDFERRHAHETPEIARAELSRLGLETRALGLAGSGDLPWFEPPPKEAIEAADTLLQRLAAIEPDGAINALGRAMSELPLHPRLARLVAEASRRGAADDGCAIAALLSAGDRLPNQTHTRGPSDLLFLLDREWSPAAKRAYTQIRRRSPARRPNNASGQDHDEALLISILAAFPDRVARRKPPPPTSHKHTGKSAAPHDQLLLANGPGAVLSPASVVRDAKLLVALDIEERSEHAAPLVRLASAIEPEWLIDLFPDRVIDRTAVEWNRTQERVESVSSLLYDDLVIEESRSGNVDPAAAAAMLAEKALETGIEKFADREEIDNLLARSAFAAEHANLTRLTGEHVRAALESLCSGLRSFGDLRSAARNGGLLESLRATYSAAQQRNLDRIAPERIQLPSGRRAKVHYESGKPPWVASRLQDFFGLRDTPRVAAGAVALVVHLLAPNNRPVQMTTDLAGFWVRLYPELRRQLGRRYPRHKWPEDPYTARLEPTGETPREK